MRELVAVMGDRFRADLSTINAVARTVTLLAGEIPGTDDAGRPVDAATYGLPVSVLDGNSVGAVARGEIPEDVGAGAPVVLVFADQPGTQFTMPTVATADDVLQLSGACTLVIQFVWRTNDTAAGRAACARWLRAARAYVCSLARKPAAWRQRDGVEVRFATSLLLQEALPAAASDAIVGFLAIDAAVREQLPVFAAFAPLS